MKSFIGGLALVTVALAVPAENDAKRAATPTVYLAGDSTMAVGGDGAQTQGIHILLLLQCRSS
jgi:rhamnogalacturonan acetylesterase